jgi:hypothetical protein
MLLVFSKLLIATERKLRVMESLLGGDPLRHVHTDTALVVVTELAVGSVTLAVKKSG